MRTNSQAAALIVLLMIVSGCRNTITGGSSASTDQTITASGGEKLESGTDDNIKFGWGLVEFHRITRRATSQPASIVTVTHTKDAKDPSASGSGSALPQTSPDGSAGFSVNKAAEAWKARSMIAIPLMAIGVALLVCGFIPFFIAIGCGRGFKIIGALCLGLSVALVIVTPLMVFGILAAGIALVVLLEWKKIKAALAGGKSA